MRRGRISPHNPLPAPDLDWYIRLAPGCVRKAVEAYDNWVGNEQVPVKVKELIMILRIELSRLNETLTLIVAGASATAVGKGASVLRSSRMSSF